MRVPHAHSNTATAVPDKLFIIQKSYIAYSARSVGSRASGSNNHLPLVDSPRIVACMQLVVCLSKIETIRISMTISYGVALQGGIPTCSRNRFSGSLLNEASLIVKWHLISVILLYGVTQIHRQYVACRSCDANRIDQWSA